MDKHITPQKTYHINGREYSCPFELTASIIVSKWKMKIVKNLYELGKRRYGELKKTIPGNITHKMLIQSLRELEDDGIVKRIMHPEVPPKVEYELTNDGIHLSKVIESMSEFGRRYELDNQTITTQPRI